MIVVEAEQPIAGESTFEATAWPSISTLAHDAPVTGVTVTDLAFAGTLTV